MVFVFKDRWEFSKLSFKYIFHEKVVFCHKIPNCPYISQIVFHILTLHLFSKIVLSISQIILKLPDYRYFLKIFLKQIFTNEKCLEDNFENVSFGFLSNCCYRRTDQNQKVYSSRFWPNFPQIVPVDCLINIIHSRDRIFSKFDLVGLCRKFWLVDSEKSDPWATVLLIYF